MARRDRKVDALAGEGSIAGKLKKQRQALESGDSTTGRPVVGGQKGLTATGEVDENSADEVLSRGYFREKE